MLFMYNINKTTLLFLTSGRIQAQSLKNNKKFDYFGQHFFGEVIGAVNKPAEKITQLNTYYIANNIRLHPFQDYYGNKILSTLKILYFQIKVALKLFYGKKIKYKVVIAPNPLITGLAAVIISKITGTKSIIEVNGNFESAFKYGHFGETKNSNMEKLKETLGKYLIRFILKKADMVKLVASSQLKHLFKNSDIPYIKHHSFPNFVPIESFLQEETEDEKYILLLGYPWYLKGVDILIKAFNKISDEYPQYRLKIVGWCPEGRDYFENLAKDNRKIDLCEPVPHKDVIPLMTKCSLYVLASRTDASPRVLREAMASKKPIIASDIDGVPTLIKDGYNGLLFEKENINDLAEKIRLVLSNKNLADKLAKNGYRYVQGNLSENCYIQNYSNMIKEVLNFK